MSLLESPSLTVLPLVVLLMACGPKDAPKAAAGADSVKSTAAAAPHQLMIVAKEYSFSAPDTVPAGLTTIQLADSGAEMHHVAFIKLNDGKTMADMEQSLKAGGPPPAWAVDHGGVNPPRPGGGVASATQTLEPGNYALLCFLESADGKPHFVKGMIRPLTVTASAGPDAPAPNADIVLTLNDYTFTPSKPLTAGKHTIRIENAAGQTHELFLSRLAPGKKAEDILTWLRKMEGPPPSEPMGGVPGIAPKMVSYMTVDLTPGDYALICFIPDAKDGKPHFAHGMIQQVHVS